MTHSKVLLASTALVGAIVTADGAGAATVAPGGALDLTLTGSIAFRAHGGDLDAARLDPGLARGLDFSNDTEVHVVARGRHDASGIEYGATIEFEADTNEDNNTDETWIFISGGFGELRLGDLDGATENSRVGGDFVAAGTGGIDGDVIDEIAVDVLEPTNTGDDTKIRYYTPVFSGLSAGISYTPNADGGDSIADKNVDPQDFVEAALVYEGELAGVPVTASVVGGACRIEQSDEDECWTWQGGASIELFGIGLAAGYGDQEIGEEQRTWVNAGIGYAFGPVNTSVTYGQKIDGDVVTNGNEIGDAYNIVVSADIGLVPGLSLAGDVGFFDNDVETGPNENDDDGVMAVTRLELAF